MMNIFKKFKIIFKKLNPFKTFANVLKNYISEKCLSELPYRWTEKTRVYHNVGHLIQIIQDVEKNVWFKELGIYEKQALLLACFFHDAIYDPHKKNNEDQSIEYFKASYISKDSKMLNVVCDLIEITKHRKRPINKLKRILWDADNMKFKTGYQGLLNIEKLIQKEYHFLSKDEYKKKRIEFLESNIGLFGTSVDKDIQKLIEYVKKYY